MPEKKRLWTKVHARLLFSGLFLMQGELLAESLKPGLWMLEIHRTNRPLDVRRCTVAEETDGSLSAILQVGDDQGDLLRSFSVVENQLMFVFHEIDLECALTPETDSTKADEWVGTCPPGAEPDTDNTLTLRLRPPTGNANGPEPNASTEEEVTDAVSSE